MINPNQPEKKITLSQIATLVKSLIRELRDSLFSVEVTNLPETQKVEVINPTEAQETVEVSNLIDHRPELKEIVNAIEAKVQKFDDSAQKKDIVKALKDLKTKPVKDLTPQVIKEITKSVKLLEKIAKAKPDYGDIVKEIKTLSDSIVDPLEKYARYDEIKTRLNDKQLQELKDALGKSTASLTQSGGGPISNQDGPITQANPLPTQVRADDSPSIDAFGRWRVSSPETLFDSKNIFNDSDLADTVENQPLFFDNQETSGTGTGTTYDDNKSSQTMTVSATTAGERVRQTKMRFNYQPGKSQLVILTFNMNGASTGITKREGLFDEKNGIFLEFIGTAISLVQRSYVTGTAVDTKVSQANWNVDKMDGTGPSGVTLDWNDTQIMYIDYEWLGVGRVRIGFVVNGMIYYAHTFNNANNLDVVYMSTPNLPLRSEISNDGTGEADSITQICSTVISEGGSQDLGLIRYASTNGTHLATTTENTIYALLGIRLKSNYIGAVIKILNLALQIHTASAKLEFIWLLNPTVAGTFTYADEGLSAVQIARGATANTVTNGYKITGGFVESGGVQIGAAGSTSRGIDNALKLGSLIDGTRDELVLAVRPIAGSSAVNVEGSITWRELT